MVRLAQVIGCIATLSVASSLGAQDRIKAPASMVRSAAAPDGAAIAGVTACAAGKPVGELGFAVDSATLAEIERRRGSLYLDAFLIGFFAEQSQKSAHPFVRCARAFVDSPLGDYNRLLESMPTSAALIDALREEQVRRREAARLLTGSGQTLGTVVANVQQVLQRIGREWRAPSAARTSLGVLAAALDAPAQLLRAEARHLRADAQSPRRSCESVCLSLDTTAAHLLELRGAINTYGVTSERATRRAAEVRALEENVSRDAIKAANPDQTAKDRARRTTEALNEARTALRADSSALRVSSASVDTILQTATQAARALEAAVTSARLAVTSVSGLLLSDSASTRGAPVQIALPRTDAVAPSAETRSPDLTVAFVDFVVDRAKQEMIYAYIARLDDKFDKDTMLAAAFPTLSSLLRRSAPDGEPQARDVAVFGLPVWRAAMVNDLQRLPLHALRSADAVCNSVPAARLSSCKQRARSLQLAARLGDNIVDGSPVLRSFEGWNETQGSRQQGVPLNLQLALKVSAQLVLMSRAQGYVVPTANGTSPLLFSSRSLQSASPEMQRAFARVLMVRAVGQETNRVIDERRFTAVLVSMTERVERLTQPAAGRAVAAGASAAGTSAGYVAREALLFVSDAADLGALMSTVQDRGTLQTARDDIQLLSGAVDAFLSASYGDGLVRILQLMDRLRGERVSDELMKMTALAATLADARSEQQVIAALQTAASPVGGWRGKAVGDVRLSLSAYPGFGGGYESVVGRDLGPGLRSSLSMGAMLPVGFDFTFASRMQERSATPFLRSFGLFLAPVDLGAVLSYRLDTSDPVTNEPQESFRQLFAPGVFLSTGLTRRWPLTMLAGWQFLPAARSVDTPSGPERRSATRWVLSFGVDVVLLEMR